ncbi:hypothetical protein D3C83_146760 [compost metagenome]
MCRGRALLRIQLGGEVARTLGQNAVSLGIDAEVSHDAVNIGSGIIRGYGE